MSEKRYCLYVHTTPNGKKYVGITSQKPTVRWHNGCGYKGTYFSRAIMKYGWENISHEVLFSDLSKEDAVKMEREYIQKLGTTNRDKGYNLSLGGDLPSNNMADEEAYRLSQSKKSHDAWNSRADSYQNKSHGKPPRNMENKYKKEVLQYDTEGNLVAVHESIAACAEALGVTKMPVSDTCNGKAKTCKGYVLRFKDDCLSDGKRGSWQSRPVVQMGADDKSVICKFESASKAARAFGKATPCTILDACKGKQITAYGYRWCFA